MSRPPISGVPGQLRKITSVSLTDDERIWFRRLGGSAWLRKQIERALNETGANKSGMARIVNDTVGITPTSNRLPD